MLEIGIDEQNSLRLLDMWKTELPGAFVTGCLFAYRFDVGVLLFSYVYAFEVLCKLNGYFKENVYNFNKTCV